MTIRWQCTNVLKANSQSTAIDKCHVCLGVTSAEKGSLQKWPVYGDIWGRFLPWPISCLANATTNTMQKVSAIAQPLQHYKHHVVMVTNMEYGKVVCKSRKRNISDNSATTVTNGRRPSLPKPIKNTKLSLQYGLGEIIFLAEFAWCVKSKVHNSNSSSSASRNFLTSIKQVIASSILPQNNLWV